MYGILHHERALSTCVIILSYVFYKLYISINMGSNIMNIVFERYDDQQDSWGYIHVS